MQPTNAEVVTQRRTLEWEEEEGEEEEKEKKATEREGELVKIGNGDRSLQAWGKKRERESRRKVVQLFSLFLSFVAAPAALNSSFLFLLAFPFPLFSSDSGKVGLEGREEKQNEDIVISFLSLWSPSNFLFFSRSLSSPTTT